MSFRRLAQTTVVAACLFVSGTESAACINTVMDVTSTADAQNLAEALNCTGDGEFNVTWYGSVAISRTFNVMDGISLNVTGNNSSISSIDGDEGRATIVGDDITSETGIFFVSGNSTLTLRNLVLQGGHSKTEDGGGAVEAQGSAASNQTVNLIDCLLTGNTGNYTGGIFANTSVVNIYGTTDFIGNNGVLGGGSLFGIHARIYLYGASIFRDNTGVLGGAVYADECDITFGGSTTFTNNTSSKRGGAVYTNECDITFSGSTTFTKNTCSLSGGAVYGHRSDIAFGGNTTFANNTSGSRGGAVRVLNSNLTFGGSTTFVNNTSSADGGALYSSECDVAFGGSTTFTTNNALLNAGAAYVSDSIITFSESATFTNNACADIGVKPLPAEGPRSPTTRPLSVEVAAIASCTVGATPPHKYINMGGWNCPGPTACYVGALFSSESDLTLRGSATFTNNKSGGIAGAVAADDSSLAFRESATFKNNKCGELGGAVAVWDSILTFRESATFNDNKSGDRGGAVFVLGSDVHFSESATFTNNTSVDGGGKYNYGDSAIKVIKSDTTFSGGATFTNNTSGVDGGAVNVKASATRFLGITTFTNNTSGVDGGAVKVISSFTYFGGRTTFTNNTSGFDGGDNNYWQSAICVQSNSLNLGDKTTFTNNTSLLNGGAIHVSGGKITTEGCVFTGNSALDNGGAISMDNSKLNIWGAANFTKNVASRAGGGIYSTGSKTVNIIGQVSFVKNSAFTDGGAMSIDVRGDVFVDGATFALNEASAGGAISIVATVGSSAVIKLGRCTFQVNNATQGGALYLFNSAEKVVVYESNFSSNTAVSSGGAIYHTGELALNDTLFVANQAGGQGLAVTSLGEVSFARKTYFERNARYCLLGEYGYDEILENDDPDTCRAEVVCAGCSNGCDDILDGLSFLFSSTVPAADCKVLPTGTLPSSTGTILTTMKLDKGYSRISNESHRVLECYQKDACVGGIDAGNYCATGYQGPYCAVCDDTYAPGLAYSCHECRGASLESAMGLMLATLIITLGVAFVAVLDLVAVVTVDGIAEEEQGAPKRFWGWRFLTCDKFLMKMFPLTSLKIIVVVWQIITQFAAIAGEVYPDEYQAFLSKLSPITLDFGLILSFSCVADIDFYDRLLFTTMIPFVAFAVLGGTYATAKHRNRRCELAIRAVQNKHISAALFILFFVYSSVSFTVFQTFVCDPLDDGVYFLRADYSLLCWSDQHVKYVAYSSFMVFVYPIGIPTVFTIWLVRNRHDLVKPDRETLERLQPFSGLWAAYRPSRFYYEIVEYGRRIALTGIAVFVFPGSAAQIAVVLLLAVVFSFISESMHPFAHKFETWLYRWGNGVVLASMYVALLRKVDVSGDNTPTQSAFAGVLIAGNMFMVVTVLVQSALIVKEFYANKPPVEVDEPCLRSTRRSSASSIQIVGDVEEAEMEATYDNMENTEYSVN